MYINCVLLLCLTIIPSVFAGVDSTVSATNTPGLFVHIEELEQSARRATRQRHYPEALADINAALKLLGVSEEYRFRIRIARLQCLLGAIYIERGNWSDAQKSLLPCLQTARNFNDSPLTAEALVKLGQNAFKQGKFEAARAYLQEAVSITTEIDDLSGLAFAKLWLGAVAALVGNYELAEQELLQAVTVAAKADDKSTEARARNILGENARLHGQYESALNYYQQALDIYQSANNRFGMTMVIHNLGHLMTMMGNLPAALKYYDRSLELAMDINAIPAALEVLAALAEIAANAGETERALDLLGLVYSNSASPKEALTMFADPTLNRLQREFPSDRINTGLAHGRSLNFEKVVAGILARKN